MKISELPPAFKSIQSRVFLVMKAKLKILPATLIFYVHIHKTLRLDKFIIESVDSISRDGPDMPIYVIHNKSKSSV